MTVTLDKTLIPEGMVFDIWSTGKFSLPLGQDYKAESITFPMSSGVDIAAQYRDATIEDDGPGVLALLRSLVLLLWAVQCWAIRPILWVLNLQAS